MGILHRVYARHAPEVWEAETRLLHAMRLVRRPVAVQWIVTAACDLHCPHCYSGAGRRVKGELTTAEAKVLLIDELVALGKPTFVLAGGELLLRKDIPELVAYACERGLSWAMHTHGLHVARFRDLFRRHPPSLAAISLDGPRDFHDRFRGREGSFDAALEAMQILKDAGCGEVVAGTTITRQSADRVAELLPVVEASAADSWGLHLFAPEGRGSEHMELMPTPEQLRRVAAFGAAMRGRLHVELCNEWGSAGADDPRYRDQPFLCGAGRISFVVSAGGEVLPCTTTDLSESEGNVREVPLRRLWARGFSRFRSAGHGACSQGQECWLQARNGVRCSEDAFGPVTRGGGAAGLIDRLPAAPAGVEARLLPERGAKAIRAAAVAAVFLQACATKVKGDAPREPPPPVASTPAPLASAFVPRASLPFPDLSGASLQRHYVLQNPGSPWKLLLRDLLAREPPPSWERARELALQIAGRREPTPLGLALGDLVERRALGKADPPAQLLALLDVVEAHPVFDAMLVAYLWQQVRDLPGLDAAATEARVTLLARLDRHLRVALALRQAEVIVGPVEFQAWRSKAAPPQGGAVRVVVPLGLLEEAKKSFPAVSAEEWTRGGAVWLAGGQGACLLVRGGTQGPPGERFLLGRLDLLRAPQGCSVKHATLGEIVLPAGAEVTLHGIDRFLGAKASADLDGLVARAGQGDAAALRDLELVGGVASRRIRAFLASVPGAQAGALEMLRLRLDE